MHLKNWFMTGCIQRSGHYTHTCIAGKQCGGCGRTMGEGVWAARLKFTLKYVTHFVLNNSIHIYKSCIATIAAAFQQ